MIQPGQRNSVFHLAINSLLLLSCLLFNTASAETLKVSTGAFSPWADQNAQHSGFVNRVIQEAFGRKGYQVEFLYRPWKRALVLAENGKVDATSFWYFSEEKQKQFIYSQPISEHKELFFHLKGKSYPQWQQLSDLKGIKIGATRGYTYTENFWKLGEQGELSIFVTNSDELNFKKLLAGRIDLFPAAEMVAWQLLRKIDPQAKDKLATLEKPLALQHGHLLFPRALKRSETLVKQFNEALSSMKADGTLEKYYQDMREGIY